MALLDHRVFRCGDEWWVAQVHSRSGIAVGMSPPSFSRGDVTFTSMSDIEAPSREHEIGAGSLNQLSHEAMCRLVVRAEKQRERFKMSPFNAPDEQAVTSAILEDEEGLRWATRRSRAIVVSTEAEVRPGLELVCLDDSALYKELAFTDVAAVDQYLTSEESLRGLIQMVKQNCYETRSTD